LFSECSRGRVYPLFFLVFSIAAGSDRALPQRTLYSISI
jgi:hypothetical protein